MPRTKTLTFYLGVDSDGDYDVHVDSVSEIIDNGAIIAPYAFYEISVKVNIPDDETFPKVHIDATAIDTKGGAIELGSIKLTLPED